MIQGCRKLNRLDVEVHSGFAFPVNPVSIGPKDVLANFELSRNDSSIEGTVKPPLGLNCQIAKTRNGAIPKE